MVYTIVGFFHLFYFVLPHHNLEVVRQAKMIWAAMCYSSSSEEEMNTHNSNAAVANVVVNGQHWLMRSRRHACLFPELEYNVTCLYTWCYLPSKYPSKAVIVNIPCSFGAS